jgi:biopolymer transport protein ExbD
MAAMTDVIFLLLLFFMISSTLVNPGAFRLSHPGNTGQATDSPRVIVSIDKNLAFYLDGKVTPFSLIEERLVGILDGTRDPVVSLQVDKSVPVEQVIRVMHITRKHDYRVTLATTPGE